MPIPATVRREDVSIPAGGRDRRRVVGAGTLRAMTRAVMFTWAITAASVGLVTVASPVEAAVVATQSCAAPTAGSPTTSDALASFEAVTPRRIVDTRDGTGGRSAPIGAGCTLRINLAAANIPAAAEAAALSVTALGSQPGFLTAFPCAQGRPATSNINTRSGGFPTPNLVVAIPDAKRAVCLYSLFEADVVIDVTGWWTIDGNQRLTTIAPVRADDSRNDPGRKAVAAGSTRKIPLGDFIPKNATAVVGNLTITEPQVDGFITAFPCDEPAPLASNLNFRAGESRAVAVVVALDTSARLCVRASTRAHVVFDVSGYYAPAPQFGPVPSFQAVSGRRLADSRSGAGGWAGKFPARTTRTLRPTASLPNDLLGTAVVLNVVVTQAEADGFVTLYPCDQPQPNSSALNYSPGGESTNMVTVDLSRTGEICIFTLTPAHVVVDLFGVVAAGDGNLAERMSFDAFTWPQFTVDGTDYIVECDVGSNDFTIEPLRGVTARLNGVPITSGTIDLATSTDDRIRVQLRRGSTVRDYSFRCVPADFPRLTTDHSGDTTAGWYVTSIRVPGAADAFAVVLDTRGVPVWYKRVVGGLVDVQRRADGRLMLMPFLGPRYGVDPDRGYWVASLAGSVFDELSTVPDPAEPGVVFPADHHEMLSLPSGRRALLSYPLLDKQDLSPLGAGYSEQDMIADGVIQEINADDTLRWSWRTSDYFGYGEVTYPVRWGPLPGYIGNEVDVFHLNSLQRVDDGSGDYVVSARHLDAVFRVDRSTAEVDWILGSISAATPNKSGATRLTIIGDPRNGPRRPHDARLVGDVLTLFDNRTDTGQPARAVAYRIDVGAGTATMLWQIADPGGRSSPGLGSNRITPSGTVLIGWGGGIQPVFGEYRTDGTPLWEVTQVAGGDAYRIVKEPVSTFSIDTLRATAGGSFQLP